MSAKSKRMRVALEGISDQSRYGLEDAVDLRERSSPPSRERCSTSLREQSSTSRRGRALLHPGTEERCSTRPCSRRGERCSSLPAALRVEVDLRERSSPSSRERCSTSFRRGALLDPGHEERGSTRVRCPRRRSPAARRLRCPAVCAPAALGAHPQPQLGWRRCWRRASCWPSSGRLQRRPGEPPAPLGAAAARPTACAPVGWWCAPTAAAILAHPCAVVVVAGRR